MRRMLISFLLVLMLPIGPVAADVVGDDTNDEYIGTGAVVLPRTSASSDRSTAITCDDCSWKLTPACSTANGGPCDSVTRGCPAAQALKRIWFSRAGAPWRDLGIVCLGPSGVLKLAAVEDWVAEQFVQGVPVLRPAAQPTQGVLPRIPVVFRTRQGSFGTRSYRLVGHRIRLTATPSWVWRFGDGRRLSTKEPGAAYPNVTVAHAYAAAGVRRVRVRTTWTARYTLDGLGPFPVSADLTQDAAMEVVVGQGRAVLIP